MVSLINKVDYKIEVAALLVALIIAIVV
uniref:Truncated vpu protein n=1 Tax=Human immunodeficiency virus type 1 TaxID=11676 RepID=A0A0H3YCY4_HV1|nr:truncated vpu protein [Human immunodeficiency virus 1]